MPDPKTLYTVVAVVVVGLVAWVGFVLATVKQQWAREASTELAEATPASVGDKSSAVLEEGEKPEPKVEEKPEAKPEEKKSEPKVEAKPEEKKSEPKPEEKKSEPKVEVEAKVEAKADEPAADAPKDESAEKAT